MENEDRTYGVGFAIHKTLLQQPPGFPNSVNEHLMKFCFPIAFNGHMAIISSDAPTLSGCNDDKDTLYENLDSLMKSIPVDNNPILLCNFNVKLGSNHGSEEHVMALHGQGKKNINRLLLLTVCAENDLSSTNTHFRMTNK